MRLNGVAICRQTHVVFVGREQNVVLGRKVPQPPLWPNIAVSDRHWSNIHLVWRSPGVRFDVFGEVTTSIENRRSSMGSCRVKGLEIAGREPAEIVTEEGTGLWTADNEATNVTQGFFQEEPT
ncbi:uncharacterized protein PV06_10045 [Exophiala oligosperma]|uniref:Uncharacterized protein n=1 Tax=Exophiala oligosperma TaxID=215243 RepID=A0A0D2ACZ0_9EURO|nr:uncharacterized protein PV06_10045 [Exophiala oligosperma]KIW38076.1 hypothetical protein PV06_10045 [Exophiala oligosperma]